MAIIVLMIGISLSIAVVFLIVFVWNMKTGQYDDTYTPSIRMLFEERKSKHASSQQPPDSKQKNDKTD